MDKNSLIGFGLLAVIMIWFFSMQEPPTPTEAEQQAVEQSEFTEDMSNESAISPEASGQLSQDTSVMDSAAMAIAQSELYRQYGPFVNAVEGDQGYITLETDLIKLSIAKKGGRIVTAELKDYQTYDSRPLLLFTEENSRLNFKFAATQNHLINTEELYFQPSEIQQDAEGRTKVLTMTAASNTGDQKVMFEYRLTDGTYLMDFDILFEGIDQARKLDNGLDIDWEVLGSKKEKSAEAERDASTIYYRYQADGEVEELSPRSFEGEKLEGVTEWVAFKQQYFTSALISKEGFDYMNSEVETFELKPVDATKGFRAKLSSAIPKTGQAIVSMQMYLGPNHYQTLKKLDNGLNEVIDLGWFGFINEWLVIPIFNYLDSKHLGYGLIIFLLTIIIKLLLFPLTYKNFKSSAKMRVLKPEIDALNERMKDAEPMKKQQATMELYRSAGANPMAGCVPMLLQFPILVALFRFFPASIELRQEKFLWADDLSSYDSILDLSQWGISIPFYGDHVSLFTILMCISTFLYTRFNMQSQASSGPQAQQMKVMMYIMPIMLLVWFNNYASGLSYYYFLANLISISQHLIIKKWFIDEDALLAKMKAKKAKPKKKSKFQQRLEEAQRQAQARK